MTLPKLKLLHIKGASIFEQLQLEEKLLRVTNENWCVFNEGSSPAIVLGISGKPPELVDLNKLKKTPVPLIKRYSGGGTVIVDENTLFVSFIFQKDVHDFPCYPEPILRWSEGFYKEALSIPHFHLRENDYVIDHLKCGGNAQYIQKHRFVHHTTFLWDYEQTKMDLLLHPPKTPSYRKGRSHQDFLCCLKDHLPSKDAFIAGIKSALANRYFVDEVTPSSLEHLEAQRISTKQLTIKYL